LKARKLAYATALKTGFGKLQWGRAVEGAETASVWVKGMTPLI